MTAPAPEPPDQAGDADAGRPPTPMRRVGDTDRQVLQAASLRRRQLRSALLYGSARTWRQQLNLWPAALVGAIAVAVIVAAVAVLSAFQQEQERRELEEQQRQAAVEIHRPPGAAP